MNPIVRAIDVGFGNTKFVTASANGKVDCAHFASLAFFGHADEVADSMGERRRTVQVSVDGLFYEVGPDVDLAADRFRSRQLHDGCTQTPEYRAFTGGALHEGSDDTGAPVHANEATRSLHISSVRATAACPDGL